MNELASSLDVNTNRETESFQILIAIRKKIPIQMMKRANRSLDVAQ